MSEESRCPAYAGTGTSGKDAAGNDAEVENNIFFQEMDALYFANIACGDPMNMLAQTPSGPQNVLGDGVPLYPSGQTTWISTDYSLQLSISLVQWGEWQRDQGQAGNMRVFDAKLPTR